MLPAAHLVAVTLVDQAAPDEGAEKAPPHQRLHAAKSARIKSGRRMKNYTCRFVVDGGRAHPIDDAAVKVHMLGQGRTEAVDEGYRPDACRGTATGTVFAQTTFHYAQKKAQDGALHGRGTLQEIAQPLGH